MRQFQRPPPNWDTRIFRFKSRDGIKPEQYLDLDRTVCITETDDQCAICLNPFLKGEVLINLPCKHRYHETCMGAWLNKAKTCPECRQAAMKSPDIKSYLSCPALNIHRLPVTFDGPGALKWINNVRSPNQVLFENYNCEFNEITIL